MEDSDSPSAPQSDAGETTPPRHINSVDATVGQPMIDRVKLRMRELEELRDTLPEDNAEARKDIDLALATVQELLTGDLAHIPPVVVVDLNRWLERNKHLGERVVQE